MLYTLPGLKSVFMAIARLPLVGPHADHEADLLRAGAKPVGMFHTKDPQLDTLKDDIESGRLIRCDVPRTVLKTGTLYGWKGTDFAPLETAYKTFHDPLSSSGDARAASFRLRNQSGFFSYYDDTLTSTMRLRDKFAMKAMEFLPLPPSQIDRKKATYLHESHMRDFFDGRRDAFVVESHMNPHLEQSAHAQKLTHLLERGDIECHEVSCALNADMVIVGQPGQEKNMDDLAFILHHYGDNEALKNDTRGLGPESEGKILGYSDTDVDYWLNRNSYSPAFQTMMDETYDLRKTIRVGLMKEMGQSWNRTP